VPNFGQDTAKQIERKRKKMVVTTVQLRLTLTGAECGVWDAAKVDTANSFGERQRLTYTTLWQRTDKATKKLMTILGKTEEQADAIFLEASAVEL
jgi:hypothetical protein